MHRHHLLILALASLAHACACRQIVQVPTPLNGWSTTARNDQDTIDLRLSFARSMERKGNKQECIKVYREIAEQTGSAIAYHRLGVLLDQSGDFVAAGRAYHKALEANPNDAQLLCDFGYSRYLVDDLVQSEIMLRRAILAAPGLERAHNNLGLLLAKQRKYDKALEAFSHVTGDAGTACLNLAYALALHGDVTASHTFASRAQKLGDDPRSQDLLDVLARAAPKSGVLLANHVDEPRPPHVIEQTSPRLSDSGWSAADE